ncbi:MAG: hypothetical protein Q4D62_10615 [Planctomycetia bacterium]|nr:hypothetical protein [Planctomycetia bacterium]
MNIEQEIWGLLRSLDSERMKEVWVVWGTVGNVQDGGGNYEFTEALKGQRVVTRCRSVEEASILFTG